jgi:Bacterial SH3 domain/SdrD B-like domain
MPDEAVPVKVVLKDESGKEIDSVTVNVPPGKHEFKNLSPGNYTLTFTVPEGYYFVPPNPSYERVAEGESSLPVQVIRTGNGLGAPGGTDDSGPSERRPPLPALLTLTIGSTLLLGNLSLLDPFVSLTDPFWRLVFGRSAQPSPSNPSNSPGSSRGGRHDRLSPQVQERLRNCLKANIERVASVPSLSELVTALLGEDQAAITETQQQIRALYKSVNQLYKLIEECDPSFIQALLETEDAENPDSSDGNSAAPASPVPDCVTVIAERVNIRAAPSLDSAVIAQALFGTCFQVDTHSWAYLSEQQRSAIVAGEGWYPVILSDGSRGYVFSRYVTELEQQHK